MKRSLVKNLFAAIVLVTLTRAGELHDYDLDDPYSTVFDGPVKVKVGDSIRFVVDENLSTGYEWKYKTNSERGLSAE